ncbi:MAG: hypothetical protein AAF456_17140 [Planctomycetota bacterium]
MPELPAAVPPPPQGAGQWQGGYEQRQSVMPRRVPRKKSSLSVRDIVAGFFAAVVLAGLVVLLIIAGIANFSGNHKPPAETDVVAVSGPPVMSSDNSERLRRKSFAFTVQGESFYLDKEHWDDSVYQNIRNSVYEADEFIVGVPPETHETHVPFWYVIADGQMLRTYEDMVELHNYHRRMATIAVSAYGAVFLFSAIGGVIVLVRRLTGK